MALHRIGRLNVYKSLKAHFNITMKAHATVKEHSKTILLNKTIIANNDIVSKVKQSKNNKKV